MQHVEYLGQGSAVSSWSLGLAALNFAQDLFARDCLVEVGQLVIAVHHGGAHHLLGPSMLGGVQSIVPVMILIILKDDRVMAQLPFLLLWKFMRGKLEKRTGHQ